MQQCSKCGSPLKDNDRACPVCGTPVPVHAGMEDLPPIPDLPAVPELPPLPDEPDVYVLEEEAPSACLPQPERTVAVGTTVPLVSAGGNKDVPAKKKRWWLWMLVLLLVLLLASGGALWWFLLRPDANDRPVRGDRNDKVPADTLRRDTLAATVPTVEFLPADTIPQDSLLNDTIDSHAPVTEDEMAYPDNGREEVTVSEPERQTNASDAAEHYAAMMGIDPEVGTTSSKPLKQGKMTKSDGSDQKRILRMRLQVDGNAHVTGMAFVDNYAFNVSGSYFDSTGRMTLSADYGKDYFTGAVSGGVFSGTYYEADGTVWSFSVPLN